QNVAFFHTNTMSQCLLGDGNTPPSPSDTGLSGNTLATHSSPVTVVPAPTAGDLIQTVPDVLPAGNGAGVSWSPDGQYLAGAHGGSPYVTVYKRDGDTLTKIANPDVWPDGNRPGASWSPDGQSPAVAQGG